MEREDEICRTKECKATARPRGSGHLDQRKAPAPKTRTRFTQVIISTKPSCYRHGESI